MDDKEDEKEKPGFWRRAEKVAGDIACLAAFLFFFVLPVVAWLRGGRRPWFVESDLLMGILVLTLMSSIGLAVTAAAAFLGERLARRVRGASVEGATLAVMEVAVFLLLSVFVAWLASKI